MLKIGMNALSWTTMMQRLLMRYEVTMVGLAISQKTELHGLDSVSHQKDKGFLFTAAAPHMLLREF